MGPLRGPPFELSPFSTGIEIHNASWNNACDGEVSEDRRNDNDGSRSY